jgi:hypothetical protein
MGKVMQQNDIIERVLAEKRRRLDKHEACAHLDEHWGLKYRPRTLDNLAWSGRGPRFYKGPNGRRIYDPPDLDVWAAEELGAPRRSTSDRPPAKVEA